ncbi:zf-HC2 domain-containing protein [Archangium violaceum]|uniref:zf-HC2 domain-containing protein n=1 Tax=Archangium violaceum TaxID=83451 RepID=UPI00193AF0FC|nr:zf-HC2 domain-containing protein [Archangium violaceum]QRK09345.1 zf-HC2 domain-containing protein [Archangium violaceum]
MNRPCNKLPLFLDGELSPEEAESFRYHLASCTSCEAALHEGLQLELLTLRAFDQEPPQVMIRARPRWDSRRWTLVSAAAGALLLTVLHVFLLQREQPEAWFSEATSRRLEARLSYPPADRYRPYEPMRGDAKSGAAPLKLLASMEERGELRGIAATYLLQGELGQAAAYLQREPPSVDRENDLAVVAMSKGSLEEALRLLREALDEQPRHPQALWNRALVLRDLGFTEQAERAFTLVASLDEDGWNEEARAQAQALRHRREKRRGARQETMAATLARLTSATPPSAEELLADPEVARMALYEAVRTASTSAQLRVLLPVAEQLDRLEGSKELGTYVREIATHDFSLRAPLAREYAALITGTHPEKEAFLERLRASAEWDIHLGSLIHAHPGERDLRALMERVKETKEPRFHLLVERELARQEEAAGHPARAEQRLLSMLHTCRLLKLDRACGELEE